MRKWLKFADGEVVELPPISFDEFMAVGQWTHASDMAWKQWKFLNGYVEADDYNEDTLAGSVFFVTLEAVDPAKFQFQPDGWSAPAKPYVEAKELDFPAVKTYLTRPYTLR